MGKTAGVVYQINNKDEIVFVNDGWDELARENNVSNLASQNIAGKLLWSFIADETTVHIYHEVVKRVRNGRTIDFQFRCDAPETYRLVNMIISPADAGGVIFETQILREWSREPYPLLQDNINRSGKLVRICSWCKKIDIGKNLWEEIEKAVNSLGLFEKEKLLPGLTHGICGDCYQIMSQKF